MLAYDKDKLNAWMNKTLVEDAAAQGLISEAERSTILSRYPSPFFNPSTIVRIGLGFSTMTAIMMFFALIRMILGINFNDFITHFLYGSGVIFLLEYMIRKKSHFRSGIDDILLYLGYGIIMTGMISLFDKIPDPSLLLTGIATVLAVLAAVRYADRLMWGLALIAFVYFTSLLVIKINSEWWVAIPLITMVISAAIWFAATKLINRPGWLYYRDCLEFIQILGLIIVGACSNYYVISELWYNSIHQEGINGFWNVFFVATTMLIPLATIITGFIQKDKKRIRIGTLMIAAAVMTFHYYLTSTPTEILTIIYGSLLLLIGYWLLKHHKAKDNGISFSEKHDSRSLFEVESLLIGAGAGLVTPENSGGRFGGGSFGGAGSGGTY
jgi:hypothetical protein